MDIFNYYSKESALELFKDLVATEAHKDIPERESPMAYAIRDHFLHEALNPELQEVEPNRPNIYCELGPDEAPIALQFNGHTDTIPGYDMTIEPFVPKIKGNRLYGRGACDMKAGIAAFMSAMIAVKRSGATLKKRVSFTGVVGEEERSAGSEKLLEREPVAERIIIGEPTSLNVCVSHKGMEWIEITCKGKSVHGSRPEEGINAIYMASAIIQEIEPNLASRIREKVDPLLGAGSICVGVIHGGEDPNIVPSKVLLQIDRRYLPSESLEEIYQELQNIIEPIEKRYGSPITMRSLEELTARTKNRPYELDAADEFATTTLGIANKISESHKSLVGFPAWSDAGIIGNHTTARCLVYGPGDIDKAHSEDEFCPLDEFYEACEVYYQLILNYCRED